MAKYELPQYQSMYVDPQSVAINTELRQRFVDSFAADDTLQATVDGMDVADFDGDVNKKNQLADQYNEQIRTRAERGDYETLGMSISRDARNFIKDYTPLQRNKEQYDNYIKTIEESEKIGAGKPGGIDSATAAKLKKYAVHNYNGLEYDEQGTLNRDSYFNGPGFVGEVDEYALIKEEMADVVARQDPKNLGFEIPLDSQGKAIIENGIINGVPRYWMTTKSGREYIDENLVLNVTNRVLNRPDVKGAFNQRALLDTYSYDQVVDDRGTTAAQVQLDEMQMSLENDINALNQKGGALTADETTKLNDLEAQLENLIENRQENGDMSTLQNVDLNNKMNEFYQSNVNKYTYDKKEYARTYDDDKEWMANNTGTENPYNVQTVSTVSEAQQVPTIGGNSTETITTYIEDRENAINTTLEYFNNLTDTNGQPIAVTNEEVLDDLLGLDNFGAGSDGTYSEDIQAMAKKYNLSPELFIEKAKQTQINKQRQLLAQQRRKETELEVFKTDDYNSVISDEYANLGFKDDGGNFSITGLRVKQALVDLGLIDKDASVKDALDFYSKNQRSSFGGSGTTAGALTDDTLQRNVLAQIAKNVGESLDPRDGKNPMDVTADDVAIRGLISNYEEKIAKDNEKVDEYYKANVKTDTGWDMPHFGDKENAAKVTKAFESTFEDPASWQTVPIYNPDPNAEKQYDENGNEEPYTIGQYMKDQNIIGVNKIKIKADQIKLSSVVRADGVSVLLIPITLEDGTVVPLRADAVGIQNEALTRWTTSAEYEAGKLWQMGVQANLPQGQFKPELLDGIIFDYKNNEVIVDGTPMKASEGLQVVANMLHRANYAKTMGSDQSEFFSKITKN